MCGIYGYIGSDAEESSVAVCIEGLKLLEYRGYDSAGIAGITKGRLKTWKQAGKIKSLEEVLEKKTESLDVAIAHTRWATHGKPSKQNAHPHMDQTRSIAIVHNGIIENHSPLRRKLIKAGYVFKSETDSEVIAQLISHHYKDDLVKAVKDALKELRGAFAIAVIHKKHPSQIVAASRESPLAIGTNSTKSKAYLSSDPNSFRGKNVEVLYLSNDEIALIEGTHIQVFDASGKPIEKEKELLDEAAETISKEGYEHFMLKEIHEQPHTIRQTLHNRISEEFGTAQFENLNLELQSTKRVLILACGTSYHAGCIAASMLENNARIPSEVHIASEFRYTNPIVSEDTLVIAISQSGETADTIAAVREAKAKGAKVLGICNVKRSSLTREADNTLLLGAGPEISVCSTKAFTSQLTLLSLFTLYMARLRHMSKEEGQAFIAELKLLPAIIKRILGMKKEIEGLAQKFASYEHFFFVGRRYMHPTSLEAALKLKEISYLNATGYPAGELKHGPLALISPKLATVGMCGNQQTFEKMLSNLMEIKARGGIILAFAPEGSDLLEEITDHILYLPKVSDELASIPYSVAGQLFAYYIAKLRGTEIDQPRNLAKSVTVE